MLKLLGECVISSVLSHRSKNLKQLTDQCHSSVLSGKTKDTTPSRSEGRTTMTQKTKRGLSPSRLPLFIHLSPPLEPALSKLGYLGGLFVLSEVLTPVLRPSFVLFSGLFPSLSF